MKKSKKEIGVAIVGAGARSGLTRFLWECGPNVKLKAIYDPDKSIMMTRIKDLKQDDAKICSTYQDAINTDGVDWVMVFSPNCYHREHIEAAFNAGKNVFSEKPLATTIEDCQAIFDAHKKSGLLFATGFVLRYSPIYRKVKEVLDSGVIGKILSIDANENITPAHGSYIMKNWRRHTKYAGPHILEKCCHDLDLINWFAGSIPSKVASFGDLNFFKPENAGMNKKYKDDFVGWHDPHGEKCAFNAEKDIIDNQVAIMEFRNNIRVMFQATLSNAIPERRMYFSCTEGTMIAELYAGEVKYKRIGSSELITYRPSGPDLHGGGDRIIMESLYNSMMKNVEPECSGEEGLESSVTAIAIEKARVEGRIFDLEKVWKKLDR